MQLHVGRQLLDHVAVRRNFGTDATRSVSRSKQVGLGTQTGLSVVDKYV